MATQLTLCSSMDASERVTRLSPVLLSEKLAAVFPCRTKVSLDVCFQVVICGLQGPIVTTVRSLLTPHPMKELRVKNTYIHHKEIKAAQGIKISAPNLENAVAGTQLFVVGKEDDEDELKDLVMEDMSDIFDKKEPEGVCVQASTLGSLEALLEFLSSDAVCT